MMITFLIGVVVVAVAVCVTTNLLSISTTTTTTTTANQPLVELPPPPTFFSYYQVSAFTTTIPNQYHTKTRYDSHSHSFHKQQQQQYHSFLSLPIISSPTTTTTTITIKRNSISRRRIATTTTSSSTSRSMILNSKIRILSSLYSVSNTNNNKNNEDEDDDDDDDESIVDVEFVRNNNVTTTTTTTSPSKSVSSSTSSSTSTSSTIPMVRRYLHRNILLAIHKFRTRPGPYLLIPCIAALVGWFTNWLAVQMIFYPINYWGIHWYRKPLIPVGLIGWQGIVPCKTIPMSQAIVDMVTTQLLSVSEAFHRLDPKMVATMLSPEIPKITKTIIKESTTSQSSGFFMWLGNTLPNTPIIGKMIHTFLQQLTILMQQNAESIFHIDTCVVRQMILDRSKLGELFQTVATKELQFLTNSGLWFGFILGLLQMFIALFWNNPWSLSIGGMIVGLATNWLALKWIFQPINPTKFGPFVLQGQFLRRQKAVAAIFAKYFADNILTSEQIWHSILTDPNTKPTFIALLASHITQTLHRYTRFIPFVNVLQKTSTTTVATAGVAATAAALTTTTTSPSSLPWITSLATKMVDLLPFHVPVLFPYMDQTLNLERTIRDRMERMTSVKFERVLHPIFEEDELTLIIAGAVLGFIAGLIQQGLETGAITIPPILRPIRNKIQSIRNKPKNNAKKNNQETTTTESDE